MYAVFKMSHTFIGTVSYTKKHTMYVILDTWAQIRARQKAENAHLSIRRALNQWNNWSTGVQHDDYLQGSYRNSTNIWRDSDVDLVVELTSVARFDTSDLSFSELQQFNASINWVSYDWANFREEVQRQRSDECADTARP